MAPIRSSTPGWLKEPLVHFLALGGLLFALHALVAAPGFAPHDKTIRITDGDLRRLVAAWELQWRRPPTSEELANLLDDHVREEILYREALALGLDRDDLIVRRRLAQKMQFLSEDTAADQQPTSADLRALFEQNPERFRPPMRTTFTHLYYSPDKRGGQVRKDADRDLLRLQAGVSVAGDPFMLQPRYVDHTAEQVAGVFGPSFASALFDLPAGSWQGPVESGFGLHLVRVESKTDDRLPTFEQAKPDVRTAWLEQARRDANETFYQRLRDSYAVETDPAVAELAAAENRQ